MYRARMVALAAAFTIGMTTVSLAQQVPDSARTRGRMQHGQMGEARARMQRSLFRGITLSDAQKTRLDAIRTAYQPRFQALRDAARPSMQAMRDARQKEDTAAARAAFSAMQKHRAESRALMQRQRDEIRGILTGEQQATFDKNVAELRDRAAKAGEHRGKHRGGARKGMRGPRRGA